MGDHRNERGIDYIELAVTDIPTAKTFYGEVFGWTFEDWGDTYCAFRDGRVDGGFRKEDSVQPGGPLVIIYTADLDAMEEAVNRAGGRIVEHLEFPGGRRFHFTDPSGNTLAVWSDR